MATTAVATPMKTPGAHQVVLTWTESLQGTTFNIYEAATSGGYNFATPLASVPAGTFTYTDTVGLVEGATRFYVVTSVLNGVESKPSNEASVVVPTSPPSPLNLVAVAT